MFGYCHLDVHTEPIIIYLQENGGQNDDEYTHM